VIIICENMSEHPIRSENELRCRSRYGVGCKTATDPWNGAVENSSARATDDQLPEESCLADVQRLQDIEPLAGADEPDSQTSASNKRQLVLFTSIFFLRCVIICWTLQQVPVSKHCLHCLLHLHTIVVWKQLGVSSCVIYIGIQKCWQDTAIHGKPGYLTRMNKLSHYNMIHLSPYNVQMEKKHLPH